jgi:hypothetical protein
MSVLREVTAWCQGRLHRGRRQQRGIGVEGGGNGVVSTLREAMTVPRKVIMARCQR